MKKSCKIIDYREITERLYNRYITVIEYKL